MRLILLMIFLIINMEIYAKDFYLIKNSKICCTFVKSDQDSTNWDSSILFFNENFKKCTGCSLPVGSKTIKNKIKFKIVSDNDLLDDDKFTITFPNLETMQITCSERSVRWAINFILEEYVGVVFLMACENGTYLPKLKDVSIPRMAITKTASFKLQRNFYPHWGQWAESLNGKNVMQFGHSISITTFPIKKYLQEKSFPKNIFPLKNGKRSFPQPLGTGKNAHYRCYWQPCWTHPDTTKEAVKNILAYLKKYPGIKSLSLGINDNGGFCQCKNCTQGGIKRNSTGHQDFSEIYYKWCNNVVEQVSKKHPDVYFGLLAYCEVFEPPSFKLHPKIVPFLTIDSYACTDLEVKAQKAKIIKQWQQKANHIGLWEYGYGGERYFLPRIYYNIQSEFIKFFNKNGGSGMFVELDYKTLGESPKLYLYYKLMWDASLNHNKVLEEWYEKCVGQKSAVYLKKYYQFWERFWRDSVPQTAWFNGTKNNVYMKLGFGDFFYALKKGDMQYCREQMEYVVKYATTIRQKKRAEILMKNFEYYEANVYASCAELIPLSQKAESEKDAIEILKNIPFAMKYLAKLPELSKLTKHRNIAPQLTAGILGAVMPFRKSQKVQHELEKISNNKKIISVIRGEAAVLYKLQKNKKSLKNLLHNPSFEETGFDWNNSGVEGCSRSKDYSYDGKFSMKWTRTSPSFKLSRFVKIKPNTAYMCFVRIFIPQEQSNVESYVQFATYLRKNLQPLSWYVPLQTKLTPGKWTLLRTYIPPHKDANRAYLWLTFTNFAKGDNVYIDDLLFTEIKTDSTIENPNKGELKKLKKFPNGWGQNFDKKWLPGSVSFVDDAKQKIVKLNGTDKGPAHCFRYKRIKASDGDKIEFTVKAKGKGIGGVGLYQYPKDGSWTWNGAVYKSFKVSKELKTYTVTLTIKGKKPTGQVCLVVWADKNSEVIVDDIKARKL